MRRDPEHEREFANIMNDYVARNQRVQTTKERVKMRRLYFMLPDLDTTKTVVDELLLKRIDEHHIHIVAKEGTAMGDLPEANLLQKSDFIPAMERGLAVGGITGILAGIAAVTFPPAGLILGGGAILGTSLAGAGNARPRLVIGFAAETENVVAHAQAKLAKKGCDWILANDVSSGTDTFGGAENEIHLVEAEGVTDWPRMTKEAVAERLALRIADHLAAEGGTA